MSMTTGKRIGAGVAVGAAALLAATAVAVATPERNADSTPSPTATSAPDSSGKVDGNGGSGQRLCGRREWRLGLAGSNRGSGHQHHRRLFGLLDSCRCGGGFGCRFPSAHHIGEEARTSRIGFGHRSVAGVAVPTDCRSGNHEGHG